MRSAFDNAPTRNTTQAPAAAADLNSSATYLPRKVLRAPRARAAGGVWRRMNNTFGAAWELNGVPPAPLHMRVTDARGRAIVIAGAVPRAGALGDVETRAQLPPLAPGDSSGGGGGSSGSDGPSLQPASPPPGAFVAPGTANVLVFGAADAAPLLADPTSAVNATGAIAHMPDAASDDGEGGGEGAADSGGSESSARDRSEPPSSSPAAGAEGAGSGGDVGQVYAVAGFEDANGDGFPDSPAPVVGMPDGGGGAAAAAAAAPPGRRRLLARRD